MASSTTTVAQITSLMLSWFDDEAAGYFNANDTLTWINFAIREVQKQLIMAGENWYVKKIETLTVVGQADYILPSDFLKEHRLEIITSGTGVNEARVPLGVITINEQDLVSINLGQPSNYYIQKDRFTLSPTPDTPNLILRLHYSYKIPDMSLTTDIPDIPEEFMEYVALLAGYNGFIKDDRVAETLNNKILEYKERLKQMAEDRTQDASRHIVMTMDYSSGGFF